MALSLAQNAIALLIDLAERGEIDPWDVKVIDVIDRFLSQLRELQPASSGQAPYEANLSESGQAFLYASMLVLLKADTLARLDATEEEPEDMEADLLDESDFVLDRPRNLEQRIRRRAVAEPPKNRRVTLQELVDQLQLIAGAIAEQKPRVRARRSRPQSRNQAVRAITQLAHQENLSEIAAVLDQFLNQYWPDISQGEEWLDFETLLDLWPQAFDFQTLVPPGSKPSAKPQIEFSAETRTKDTSQLETTLDHAHDRVGVFWALLFLSAQSKVELSQETFYQDLKVRSLVDEASDEASNEPVNPQVED